MQRKTHLELVPDLPPVPPEPRRATVTRSRGTWYVTFDGSKAIYSEPDRATLDGMIIPHGPFETRAAAKKYVEDLCLTPVR